jgi:hypothetical protein
MLFSSKVIRRMSQVDVNIAYVGEIHIGDNIIDYAKALMVTQLFHDGVNLGFPSQEDVALMIGAHWPIIDAKMAAYAVVAACRELLVDDDGIEFDKEIEFINDGETTTKAA